MTVIISECQSQLENIKENVHSNINRIVALMRDYFQPLHTNPNAHIIPQIGFDILETGVEY